MGELFRAELAGSDDREAQLRLSTVEESGPWCGLWPAVQSSALRLLIRDAS